MSAADIVAYQYRADEYCPDCIVREVSRSTFVSNFTMSDIGPENGLDKIAAVLGIDRGDERNYDSDEFPKVCFESDMETIEEDGEVWKRVCASCGKELSI